MVILPDSRKNSSVINRMLAAPLLFLLILNFCTEIKAQSKGNEQANAEKLKTLYSLFSETYKNSTDKGVKYAEEALQLASETGNKFIQVKADIYIGKNATRERNIGRAKKCFAEAVDLSRQMKNEFLEAESSLGYSIFLGYALNRPDSALMMAKKSYSLGISLNDSTLIQSSSYYLVVFNRMNNDPVNAIAASKNALRLCANNPLLKGSIYSELVFIYTDFGNLKEAIKYYNLALQYSDYTKSGIQLAGMANKIASIEGQELNTVLQYRRKAIDIYSNLKEPFGVGYTYNLIGMDYLQAGITNEAVNYFKKAINTLEPMNSRQHLAFANSNLAAAYIKMGLFDQAEKPIQNALRLGREINDKLALSDAYKTAAQYYRKTGKIDKAINNLNIAEQYAREIKNANFLKDIYDEFSICYEAKEDSKKALAYLKLKNEIADTLQKQSSRKAYIEMMVKYETNHTKEEILKAKQNISELEKESGRKSFLFWFVIAGGVISVSVLSLFYRKKIFRLVNFYREIKHKPFRDRRGDKSAVKIMENGNSENRTENGELYVRIRHELNKLMEEEKKYLDPELTLSETARILNTNTAYLSKVINEQGEMNFNNYINRYRIEDAKALLESGKQDFLTFEGIGKSCGFLSRSSFNKAFKKFTNLTPSEYVAGRNKTP